MITNVFWWQGCPLVAPWVSCEDIQSIYFWPHFQGYAQYVGGSCLFMLIPMTWQWLAGHILITRCSVFANVWRWKGAEINLYLPHPSRFHSTNKGETNELENVKPYLLMYLSCFFWSKNIKAQIVLYSSILFLKMFSNLGIHLGAGIIHLCLLILGLSQNNMKMDVFQ